MAIDRSISYIPGNNQLVWTKLDLMPNRQVSLLNSNFAFDHLDMKVTSNQRNETKLRMLNIFKTEVI